MPRIRSDHAVRPLACLSVLVLASGAAAAEMDVSDLRLGFGVLPRNFEGGSTTTVTNSSGTVTSSTSGTPGGQEPDRHWRGHIQYMVGHLAPAGGFLIGADLGVNQARFEGAGSTATWTTPVVDLLLGYGFAPTPNWHFELTPFAGLGWTFYEISGNNQTDVNLDEYYLEYGIRAATYITFKSGFQLGLEVPLVWGHYDPSYTSTDSSTGDRVTVQDDRRNQGLGVIGSLGVRF